jgi:hypothetical protein
VHTGYIMLEMLARNKLLQYPGAGGDLVRVVERSVAPQLGISEIRMEALQHVVRYYDDILGYEESGRLTGIPSGVCLPLRGSCCLGDLSLWAKCLGVDQMCALGGFCAHFSDVLLDVGAFPEVSLNLSGDIGAAIKRGPSQG